MSDHDTTDSPDPAAGVTGLLAQIRAGDESASSKLLTLVYPELRALARAVFSGERKGHTLQPTAIVHEACLKLAGSLEAIDDRRHFFVIAGRAMRQVVADHARGRQADKRGGGRLRVTLNSGIAGLCDDGIDLVALHDCLEALAEANERHAQVVELRLFSGLSIEETAEALGISPRSVDSDWAMAKAWLRLHLS